MASLRQSLGASVLVQMAVLGTLVTHALLRLPACSSKADSLHHARDVRGLSCVVTSTRFAVASGVASSWTFIGQASTHPSCSVFAGVSRH